MKHSGLVPPSCRDGAGYLQRHLAEGWLVSPEHKAIVQMCANEARTCIDEYRAKLGENWTFKRCEEHGEYAL